MNRNFLTAFCIVALVGLSCPIVAKLACPVDEYFNQELQVVTGDNVPYQFFIVAQPVSIVTSNTTNVRFSCAVQYTKDVDDLVFQWYLKLSGWNNFVAVGDPISGVHQSFSSPYSPTLNNNTLFYCTISDGHTTLVSDTVNLVYTGSSKSADSDTKDFDSEVYYDFQFGGEENEKSEVIDEPKRKQEDIEESETELSEDTEITE